MKVADEQLRQERETFELHKSHVARWFTLRLCMGYAALVILVVLAAFCGFIILNYQVYTAVSVTFATIFLGVDLVGLLTAMWRLVLSPTSALALEPVTRAIKRNSDRMSRSRSITQGEQT